MADAVTTRAMCWRVERRDGIAIGLTDHDRDLTIEGLTYRAAPGMTPSAVERSDGLEPDTMDIAGALTSGGIREDDLLAGRWDGARVDLFAADWSGQEPPIPLGGGTVGQVDTRDGAFTAELAGPTVALSRPAVEQTSAACRAELGDRRCRVAMRGRTVVASVVEVAGDDTIMLDHDEPTANAYGEGRLRWLSGDNCGLTCAIAVSAGASVTLREMPVHRIAPGTLVRLSEGCDGTIATCARRFGNAANFRGEPYLPGIDLLTRYPGA